MDNNQKMTTKVKVGIYGGGGYTAGELIRLLANHPMVQITCVQSHSQSGRDLSVVHRDLTGEIDLAFSDQLTWDFDVLFLCKGHGESMKFFVDNEKRLSDIRLIDLSMDFRSRSNKVGFIYGLPELYPTEIRKAMRIANPGCFATAIQLALLPAVQHRLINSPISISGITGSTGAGQKMSNNSHFSWRNNNVSVYKALAHQHLAEVKENLETACSDFDETLHFIPYRGNFTRGIIVTSHFLCDTDIDEVYKLYSYYYRHAKFTNTTDQNPDVKLVVNTNKALVYLEKIGDQLVVISVIDNLLKGASGQAVQNMNIMMGWEEMLGLKLKSIGF